MGRILTVLTKIIPFKTNTLIPWGEIETKQCEFKKMKPRFDSKFRKIKEDISKLISVHDSVIILLSFGTLFIHIWPWTAAR